MLPELAQTAHGAHSTAPVEELHAVVGYGFRAHSNPVLFRSVAFEGEMTTSSIAHSRTSTCSRPAGECSRVSVSVGAVAFSLLVNGLDGQAHAVRERVDRVVETIAEARKGH